jgi:hypothetical protein
MLHNAAAPNKPHTATDATLSARAAQLAAVARP